MQDRRTILRLGGLGLAGALAGCSGSESTPTDAQSDSSTATPTPASGGEQPPGADQFGAAGSLQSSATVRAAVLDSDEGAGRFVFTPAVVWVEPGAPVTWEIEGASHSVTAYHAGNDKPQRVPEAAPAWNSGTLAAGETFEHTFETKGVHNYFCKPHESLGMVGLVVVGGPQGGPGTTTPSELSGKAASHLARLIELAGVKGSGGGGASNYGWQTATFDSYWYSLYNMSTNIVLSGNGVTFPNTDEQRQQFSERLPAMLEIAGEKKPPVKNPNLNMLPFTAGDPHFTEKPVFSGPDGRPDASTLAWDRANSSMTVSPESVAWTHLKGVTWAKNFEAHFGILPDSLAAEFRSMVLATMAQVGTGAALVQGGPQGNGLLTKGDDTLQMVGGVNPVRGEVTDARSYPNDHTAMLWFLSDLVSLARGGWYGYENPEPVIPPKKVQMLADGMAKTTMNAFSPGDIVAAGSTRDLGQALGALGWYGTHAGSAELEAKAATYANGLAAEVEANLAGNGKVENGTANQAATQGAVAQGLAWASQIDGVDHTDTASEVVGYMRDVLWDGDAGTYASGQDASTYTVSARDAGDITGGLNAADAVLGASGVKQEFAAFFNNTFNRGRLQRAERPPSRDASAEYVLPLPPKAGGEFGQAAVYNGEVEYDPDADEWSVTDGRFYTGEALYLANQDVWVGNWGGDFYQGRGVPGESDAPPE